MTTIFGGAHLLAHRDLSEDRRRAVALDVGQEAEHLYWLVEDLLVLLQADRGAIAPVGEPVAVGRLISAAIERELVRNPRVQIRYLGARDAAIDGVDEQLMAHVVRNLLANAIAESSHGRPVEIVVERHDDEVGVRFLDSGTMAARPSESIDPFVRWPQARARVALFAAVRLVAAMHGRCWAHPRAGGGTEFGLALPIHPPGRGETVPAAAGALD